MIYGEVMPSTSLAQNVAAILLSIKLYECGELKSNLTPKDSKTIVTDETVNFLFPVWENETKEDKEARKLGTMKKKRQHEIVVRERDI